MESNTLKPGSKLKNGEYLIARILGQGGFGITYEAEQVSLGRKVAVKEFFMKDLCNRDGATSNVSVPSIGSIELVERFKQKFLREARMIAGFDNEHIVRIHDVFEENGTAYYVMEFLNGGSLGDVIKSKGRLPEKEALQYLDKIASALKYLHKRNILHFDVKPSNVLLGEEGKLKLIDFGISKHFDEGGHQTSSTPIGISKGFAPLEQYQQEDIASFSPATDIYALGATLFNMLTGSVPPEASAVMNNGLPAMSDVSNLIAAAIEKAMSPRKKDRPQTIDDFLSLLNTKEEKSADEEETTTMYTPEPAPEPSPTPSPERNAPKWLWIALSAAAAIILCVILWPESRRVKEDPDKLDPEQLSVPSQSTKPVTGTLAGHEWVDLGLPSGLKWATTNVGASNPGDYGDYYAWGEVSPKSMYNWKTYKWCNGSGISLTKYNTKSPHGIVDNQGRLNLSDDAANHNWGSNWRTPTTGEFYELQLNCTSKWVWQNGHYGLKFVSKINGKSIFLPAAGRCLDGDFVDADSNGYYWSASLATYNPDEAWDYRLSEHAGCINSRSNGNSIRPVTE